MPRDEFILAVMENLWHAVILARAAIQLAIDAVMESSCRVATLATAAIQMATKAVMESSWCVVILAIAAVEKAINAVMESLRGVAMLARATIEKAVSAMMERVHHIVMLDVGKSPCRSAKKGGKKTRSRLTKRLSRAGILRCDASKIFCHMISGLDLAHSGVEAGCHSQICAMADLLPLLVATFWSGQSAKKQAETHRGTSLEQNRVWIFAGCFSRFSELLQLGGADAFLASDQHCIRCKR